MLFVKIRFVIFFLWNGCRNPFQGNVKRMSTFVSLFFLFFNETDVEIRFRKMWNESQSPFNYFFLFFTDIEIRFIFFWNWYRNPFRYFFDFFFTKRMSKSVLEKYETDLNIHFNKKKKKNNETDVSQFSETNLNIPLVFFFFFCLLRRWKALVLFLSLEIVETGCMHAAYTETAAYIETAASNSCPKLLRGGALHRLKFQQWRWLWQRWRGSKRMWMWLC